MQNKILVLAVLLLAACGNQQRDDQTAPAVINDQVHVDASSIIWQGSAADDLNLNASLQNSMSCIRSNYTGTLRPGAPLVVLTDSLIDCGDPARRYLGCTDRNNGIIYLMAAPNLDNLGLIFVHETIHWATNLGSEAHNGPLFAACSPGLTE